MVSQLKDTYRSYLQIKVGIHIMFFLLLNKNISYGYSFEAGIILAQNIMGENILFSQNKIIEFIL